MFAAGQRVQKQTSYNSRKLSFRQKLRNWLMDDNGYTDNTIVSIDSASDLNSNPLRLSIFRAAGGTIIETSFYNRKNDENDRRLHIITDDKDLGQEIGKIITMESLRG
jgi:hypothetical protein